MPHPIRRLLVALNAVAGILIAIAVVIAYLPDALHSLDSAWTLVCLLWGLPLPFLAAYEACGGFKGAPAKFGYAGLVLNLVYLVVAGAEVVSAQSRGAGLGQFLVVMLALSPLATINFFALAFIQKSDA